MDSGRLFLLPLYAMSLVFPPIAEFFSNPHPPCYKKTRPRDPIIQRKVNTRMFEYRCSRNFLGNWHRAHCSSEATCIHCDLRSPGHWLLHYLCTTQDAWCILPAHLPGKNIHECTYDPYEEWIFHSMFFSQNRLKIPQDLTSGFD